MRIAAIAPLIFLGLVACSDDKPGTDNDLAASVDLAALDLSGFIKPMDLSVLPDLALNNADMTTVTCTALDGKFTVNGGLPQTMNTVNTGVAAGALHITMTCASPTAFTWSIMSGSCGAGAGVSNMGRTYDCQLASSSNVSFNITNQNDTGVTATRTFVSF